jgi:hypothetical protein
MEKKELLEYFAEEGIYIHDIDFTRDYKGLFNKQELIQHMEQELGFVMAGTIIGTLSEDFEEREATIMDNNKMVGRNCLTFLRNTENGTVRYKVYNKFVQSAESPSVRGTVGNYLANWCNNPEKELAFPIPKSLNTGLLRLEITFYRQDLNDIPLTRDFIEESTDYLKSCIPPNLLYYNPIQTQWDVLLDKFHNNICLVDLDKKFGLLSLYINKLTGKTNSFYIKDVSSNKLSNFLKLYTFNVPIVVVLLKKDKETILLQQDTYIKTIESSAKKEAYK